MPKLSCLFYGHQKVQIGRFQCMCVKCGKRWGVSDTVAQFIAKAMNE